MTFQTSLTLLLFFVVSVHPFAGHAQVIAPSAEEVAFQYSAQFLTDGDPEAEAAVHSQYLFGVLHSPSMVAAFDLNPELQEGLGGPRLPLTIQVGKVWIDEQGRQVVNYQAFGRMLLHKKVVTQSRASASLNLYLPYDISKIYLKKCTDAYYFGFGDYWYFWDPYREGCERLQQASITREVTLKFTWITSVPSEQTPDLEKLRGDNGNGEKLSVFVLNGFADSSKAIADEGRAGFHAIEAMFEQRGFTVEHLNRSPLITRNRYTQRLDRGGKTIDVEVTHQLANTDIAADAITFARAFKQAVREGDLVVYLGHSGLGANLDIPSLNEKLKANGDGPIEFTRDKYQIFFFDSCSSYSYYLPHFRELKPKGKIDIISYGLSSYFHTSGEVFKVFADIFIGLDSARPWEDILKAMEKPLGRSSYLLNVGAI